jgi:TolA-binding protein
MNSKGLIIGIILIIIGGSLFVLYDRYVRPERDAQNIVEESRLIMERGDRDSANLAINTLRKVLVKYGNTRSAPSAYYMTGLAYEKIGLYRLAYLKYSYLFKHPLYEKSSASLLNDAKIAMNRIKILRNYSAEGMHNLYNMLDGSQNTELRSRVYSELGQAYLRSNDLKQATTSFDIALQENSSNEEAIIGKARALKKSGLDDEAFNLYDYYLKYYGMVSPYSADVKATYLNELYAAAINAFKAANYNRSIDLFSRLLGRFGDNRLSENALYWIGESYFAQKKFEAAIGYFNKVLSNGYYHKDEDAQIKKGYAYFIMKRFDIAAREFQTYLKNYPHGRLAEDAKRWKDMSTQEIKIKVENFKAPAVSDADEGIKTPEQKQPVTEPEKKVDDTPKTNPPDEGKTAPEEKKKENPFGNEEVTGTDEIELDNIAEM